MKMPWRSATPHPDSVISGWFIGGAAAAGTVFSFLGVMNVYLLIAALVLMTVEVVTEWGSKDRRHAETFNVRHNIRGKLMTLALLVVALVLDKVFITLAPDGFRNALIEYNWITKSTLVWIILGESACILKHVEKTEGRAAIPPVIRWVLRQIRLMDQRRWPHGDGKPPRRWYDDLTDQDIEELLKKLDRKKVTVQEQTQIAQHPHESLESNSE